MHLLLEQGAPVDGFGVGTRMNTASDMPYLDCAYKLVEYGGQPRRKQSVGKATWPGCKQVYRRYDVHGVMLSDTLTLQHEQLFGTALLQPVIRGSLLLNPAPPLTDIRAYAQSQLAALPAALRSLDTAAPYPVAVSKSMQALAREVDERQRAQAEADRGRWGFNAE